MEKLIAVVDQKNIQNRLIIQSFDVNTLKILQQTSLKVKLSLLVQGKMNLTEEQLIKYGLTEKEVADYFKQMSAKKGGMEEELANLGFVPYI